MIRKPADSVPSPNEALLEGRVPMLGGASGGACRPSSSPSASAPGPASGSGTGRAAMFLSAWLEAGVVVELAPGRYALTPN